MNLNEYRVVLSLLVSLCFPVTLLAADAKGSPAKLTVKQIVQKHVAARGGLAAWHGVEAMTWKGKMDAGYGDSVSRSERYVSDALARKSKGVRTAAQVSDPKADAKKQVQVPFLIEVKRPAKVRVEIEFAGKTAVQVFDGTKGWLLRPYLNRSDWEPFTAEQAKAQDKWELDGPLVNSAAEGTKVELVRVEPVEGHDAYKLKLTHKGGAVQHVWIDTKSFLDVKVEGKPRQLDGKAHSVWVTQRDFRPVQGVMVPFVLETAVDGSTDTHQMIIDKVAINPPLNDARFTRPRT